MPGRKQGGVRQDCSQTDGLHQRNTKTQQGILLITVVWRHFGTRDCWHKWLLDMVFSCTSESPPKSLKTCHFTSQNNIFSAILLSAYKFIKHSVNAPFFSGLTKTAEVSHLCRVFWKLERSESKISEQGQTRSTVGSYLLGIWRFFGFPKRAVYKKLFCQYPIRRQAK